MTAEQPIAQIEGAENRRRVTLQRTFRVSMEELWSALVDPDRIGSWFAPAKIDPRVGGRIELAAHDGSRMMEGMIRVFDVPRIFEYDWISEYETTVVRYELQEDGAGTRLTLTERLLTDKATERRGAGWHHHLERLEAHLLGQESPPSEARWRQLREVYAKQL
jgi:uncharacterized protein YndB with AHSA1/START domain